MRSVILGYSLFIFFISSSSFCLAQGDRIQKKLDSLQKRDNLIDWINERVDYTAIDPQLRLPFLLTTQAKVWRKAKTDDEHYVWLNLLSNQGYYQLLNGNILGSINSYENAFAYYRKNKVANYEIVEYTTKPLSNNYTRIGDYERALYLQLLALKFLKQTKDNPANIASVYSNIAISYRSMGNYKAAKVNIDSGLKLVPANSQSAIILNNILAGILFDTKDFTNAAKLIDGNIQTQRSVTPSNAYWQLGSYSTGGSIYKALDQPEKAIKYFSKALLILNQYFNGSRLREKANILTQIGTIKLSQNKPQSALTFFHQTLFTLKISDAAHKVQLNKIYGDNMVVDVFKALGDTYLKLKQPNEAYQNIKFALLSSDKIRNEFADDKTKERLQANLKYIAEKGIEINYNLYLQTKNKAFLNEILHLAEQTKSRTLFDRIKKNQQLNTANKKDTLFIKKEALERAIVYNEKQEIENEQIASVKTTAGLKFDLAMVNKQIKLKYKQFDLGNYQVSVADLLSASPNKRIIEYFFGKEVIYIIDIKDRKVSNVVRLAGASVIRTNIQSYTNTYFQNGPNAMLGSPKEFYLASNSIYQSVLAEIKFKKNEQVIIIPDEVLGYISFDGLITDPKFSPNISSWPFLIKSNIITYAFSLKTLTSSRSQENGKGFAGLFITQQKNNNKPLKAVQDEASAIKKIVRGEFLFNQEVNSKSFSKVFEESKILHIGTHAYLSGKNMEPTLDFENEKVFLFELVTKKSAASLVVLSACRTADGILANGEGIISLSRGFNAIGTPATIAGLWNVNDVAASVITSNFYKHLLTNQTAGNALHNAKIGWLNSAKTTDAFYLPYYWDSLIYMGKDQKIELSPAINWNIILIILAGLTLAIATFIILKKKFWRKTKVSA